MLKKLAVVFSLLTSAACAQSYTTLQWGLDKTATPYNFGANLAGTWSNLGTISSAGVWTLNPTTVNVTGFNVLGSKDAATYGLVDDPTCAQNQTTKLQNAINGAGAGGTLHIRGSVTFCITQVTIPYSNFTLFMDPAARLLMTDATKTGIVVGTPYSVTPFAYTESVTFENLQIGVKSGVVMNSGTYAVAAYQTKNLYFHVGNIGYHKFYDGSIYLYNGVLIDGFYETVFDNISIGAIANDAVDIIGENGQGTDIYFLNGTEIQCDLQNPGAASRNNGAGISILTGVGGVAFQNINQGTCNNGVAIVQAGTLDNREVFFGQQSWFDSNKSWAIYVGAPSGGHVPYGIIDCVGCWLSGNKSGALYVSPGQSSSSLIRLQSPITYTNGTNSSSNNIMMDGGTVELRGGYIHGSSGNGIHVNTGATLIVDNPTIDYSGSFGIVGDAGSTIQIGTAIFSNNVTADFLSVGTVSSFAMPALKGIINGNVCSNLNGSLFSKATSCNNVLLPLTYTIGTLPTCNAAALGSLAMVSNGTAYGTGTYGSAVSATGAVTRYVACTNTAGPTTYAWAYN